MTEASKPALVQVAETRYYLRVTLIVAAGILVGGLLEWVPQEPSPWR